MNFQFKIDKLIEANGLTKSKFAQLIGVSRDTVYNLNENTKIGTYLKICEYFKIHLSDLTDIKMDAKKLNKTNIYLELGDNDILKIDLGNKRLEILKK